MIFKPTRRAFMLRYFIFPYFLAAGVLMTIFASLHNGVFSWKYFGIWIALTMIPALLLSFSRRRFGWFFVTLLLNTVGWILFFYVKDDFAVEDFELEIKNFFTTDFVRLLVMNSPYLIFVLISVIALVLVDIYRASFKYEIKSNSLHMTFGILGTNEYFLPKNKIDSVYKRRSPLDYLLGIGHVIPVGAAGIGTGNTGMLGGFAAGGGTKKAGVGGFIGKTTDVKEFVPDPRYCFYGIANPDKIVKIIENSIEGTYHPEQNNYLKEQKPE
jgi:hypothetical protein